jgi:hypothetical protein
MNSLRYRLNEFVSDNLEEIKNNFGIIPTLENVDDNSFEYKYAEQYSTQFYFAGVANILQRVKELIQE